MDKEAKIEKKEPLLNELESFLEACRNGCEPMTTGEDGVHALKAAIAAIESYTTKSAVKISPEGYFAGRMEQSTGAVV